MRKKTNSSRKKHWWSIGALLLALLSKGKTFLALFKLSKFGSAAVSMAITAGAYALVYPVAFSVGFVLLLFVHELGHVWAAKRKGLPVTAPLFVPFLGAFIAMKRHPRAAETEAYIAMGGPLLGTAGATLLFLAGWMADAPLLIVLGYVGFFLNLINLVPVHPLDGGRIVTAVTRWLWVVGLVLGLWLIVALRWWLLMIFWAMFAWNLFQTYIRGRKHGQPFQPVVQVAVDLGEEWKSPAWSALLPGEQHQRDLPVLTYSTLDGEQKLVLVWEGIGLNETIALSQQCLIRRVRVVGVERVPKEAPERLNVRILIEGETFVSERYYDVPARKRWQYGLLYAGLALFLSAMMAWSHGMIERASGIGPLVN